MPRERGGTRSWIVETIEAILLEADFLVNIHGMGIKEKAVQSFKRKVFKMTTSEMEMMEILWIQLIQWGLNAQKVKKKKFQNIYKLEKKRGEMC